MADGFTPVGANIQAPQGMSLADVMNIARGAQAYQQAQQINPVQLEAARAQLQTQQSQAAVNQMTANERQKVAPILQNIKEYLSDDGSFDFNKFTNDVMNVAPTTGAEYVKNAMGIVTDNIKTKREWMSLDKDSREQAGSLLSGLAQYDLPTATAKIDEYSKQFPMLAKALQSTWKTQVLPQIKAGANLPDILRLAGTSQQGIGTQKELGTPSYVTTGSVQTQVNPFAKAVNPSAPSAMAAAYPSASPEEISADLFGNPVKKKTDPITREITYQPLNPGGPKPIMAAPAGYTALDAQPAQQEITNTRNAASNLNTRLFNNRQIVSMARNALTGPLSSWRVDAAQFPFISGLTGDAAADTKTLEEFLSRESAEAAKDAGGSPTQAGLAASTIAGTTSDPRLSLQRKAIINEALLQGASLRAQGMDKAIKNDKTGPFEALQFKKDWASNFSPEAMILYNAQNAPKLPNGQPDPAYVDMVNQVKQSIGFKEGRPMSEQPVRVQAILKQLQNLDNLANFGVIK